MSAAQQKFQVDVVLPTYNEQQVVDQMHARLRAALDSLTDEFHFIYVDDGSRDGTVDALRELQLRDPRVNVLELSRNFGHQAALTAGLDAANGDVVITLDADGQHPPELIPQMLDLVRQGYDIVQTQRIDSSQPFSLKKLSSAMFYRLLNALSGTQVQPGTADYRALTRRAAQALKSMPEYHRFLRGMVSWMGFKTIILPYQPENRTAGESKYSIGKMMRLAMDAIFSFSLVPLYIGLSFGALLFCLAAAEMAYVLSFWIRGDTAALAPGWSSLMFVILIVGGMLMALLGFIGVYIGYIFQEVKRRPLYLVKEQPRDE